MKELDAGGKAWLLKYAKKNYWRVASWVEFDDLIQDGLECFAETLYRYPTATTPQHVMSLFKLVYRSRIEDLVRANRKQVDFAAGDIIADDWRSSVNTALQTLDFASLGMFIKSAPKEVQDFLNFIATEPGRQALNLPYKKDPRGIRETFNDRFCKLLGFDPDATDIAGATRAFFAVM